MRFGMGAALHLKDKRIEGVEFIPLLTQNRIVEFCPRIPRGPQAEQFFKQFIPASGARGAKVERRGHGGWLHLAGR